MKGSSFKYLLKEGVRNLWTNRVMAFTSVGVLTTCLLIVGTAYLLTANVDSMVSYVGGQSEMSIFLNEFVAPKPEQTPPAKGDNTKVKDDTTKTDGAEIKKANTYSSNQDRITAIKAEVEANPNVKSCEYISKEQGLENTKEMLGDKGYLLDSITDRNYIPDTFVITLKDVSLTAQTKSQLEKSAEVELIIASTTVSDTLTYIQRTINTLGTAIIIALGIISLVIISNTIRATIFTRRKEINIMKFVGATNSFIRIPFIVEGFVLGLISAVISYFVIWGSYSYLIQAFTTDVSVWLNSAFTSIIPFNEIALNLALFFVLTGTLLGSIGSVISIRNHARV
ncbi:MAG: permease-like cell division protein FtsX [Oscillospiraceae bacterium]